MCLRAFRVGLERRSNAARVRAATSQGREIFLAAARKIFLTKSHPLRLRFAEARRSEGELRINSVARRHSFSDGARTQSAIFVNSLP